MWWSLIPLILLLWGLTSVNKDFEGIPGYVMNICVTNSKSRTEQKGGGYKRRVMRRRVEERTERQRDCGV